MKAWLTICAPIADSNICPHYLLSAKASRYDKPICTLSRALLYTWYFGMLARLRAMSIENFCSPVTNPLSPKRFR